MHMKIFTRIVCAILLSIGMMLPVFADYGVAVDSSDKDSISLSWDEQEWADFYQVSYGKNTKKYSETSDILEKTNYDMLGLTENTTYYFIVEGFDDSGNSLFVSEELTANTGTKKSKPEATKSFWLTKVDQTGVDELTLTFSNPISTKQESSQREFTIESVEDSSDYFTVSTSEISEDDSHKLIVTLDGEPSQGLEYKVVVIALEDENGKNIEFGVDSENTFIGGYQEELNSAESNTEEQETEQWEQPEEDNTSVEAPSGGKSGVSAKDITTENLAKDVHSASENKKDLPETGPEHALLFFIALLASAFFFIPKYVKK